MLYKYYETAASAFKVKLASLQAQRPKPDLRRIVPRGRKGARQRAHLGDKRRDQSAYKEDRRFCDSETDSVDGGREQLSLRKAGNDLVRGQRR